MSAVVVDAMLPGSKTMGATPTVPVDADSPRRSGMGVMLFTVAAVALLYLGWQARDTGHITAASGLGYALGIVGGVMMALLLLYPLRKKQVFLFRWGAVRYWFLVHMMFGVLGPVIIMFHSNFTLGATNSNVALISMLLVAGSGIVGRYIYTRIHDGLYGARASLDDLRQRIAAAQGGLAKLLHAVPRAAAMLARLETLLLRERSTLVTLLLVPWFALYAWYVRARSAHLIDRALVRHGRRAEWSRDRTRRARKKAAGYIAGYVDNLRRVSEFGAYERLFAWWHVLHLPLFVMMLLTGVVHVVAVHMY